MSLKELKEIREKAFLLCKEYLHGSWTEISPDQIQVTKISGGLSNLLYLCCLPSGVSPSREEPSRVLLRLFGQLKEASREGVLTDAVIFTLLSERQRGPRLFGVFPGGRLEEYIPARPLLTRELSDPVLSGKIAVKLCQIHSMRVPVNKHPRWLWDTMHKWIHTAANIDTSKLSPCAATMLGDKFMAYDLTKELQWLRRELVEVGSPVVFCHNDLQEGNILLRDKHADIVVIDFEYSAYNYRGFDFANHMCEWMYDYSYTEPPYFVADTHAFPTPQQQEVFARCYLSAVSGRDQEVAQLLRETRIFTLASHLFWALWSVVNGAVSTIPFDYWVYGEARFEAYFRHKDLLIATNELKP